MSVSSVALSSLTTNPPPQRAEIQPSSAKDATNAPAPTEEEERPQKAAVSPKVGQVIDISA